MYACTEILPTAEWEQNTENAPLVWSGKFLVTLIKESRHLSGSQADDQSVVYSVFSSLKSPMAYKKLCEIAQLTTRNTCNAGRADVLNDFSPLLLPAKQTWHQHTHPHTLLFCTPGKHIEWYSACREQTAAQQHSRLTLLQGRGEEKGKKTLKIQILWEDSTFSPTFFFLSSFKCQTPTQFLWKFEQLVSSVWKQNKPQHISPFAELCKRQHAFQSGDYSAFSSLGLGCRPKIQNIFCTSVLNQGLFSIKVAEFLILNSFLNWSLLYLGTSDGSGWFCCSIAHSA